MGIDIRINAIIPCRSTWQPTRSMATQRLPLLTSILAAAILLLNQANTVNGHARLMEPVSRASAWRKGFENPADYNDNQGYCGGFQAQWTENKGRCGICGDKFNGANREHEAPGGRYANGIIVKKYRPGQIIDIEIDVTANHRGHFLFKLCANNDPSRDSDQRCFDRHILKAYPQMTEKYVLPSDETRVYPLKLKLPDGLECSQCVLQWTWYTANSWGTCRNGTGAIGCGAQETFRACSDIAITSTGSIDDVFTNEIPDVKRPRNKGKNQPSNGKNFFSYIWRGSSEEKFPVFTKKKPGFKGQKRPKGRQGRPKKVQQTITTYRPKVIFQASGEFPSAPTAKPAQKAEGPIFTRQPPRPRRPTQPRRRRPTAQPEFGGKRPVKRPDKQKPYGYFSINMGSSDDAVSVFLGVPGDTVEDEVDQQRLNEFKDIFEEAVSPRFKP